MKEWCEQLRTENTGLHLAVAGLKSEVQSFTHLNTENTNLRQTVTQLQSELAQYKNQQNLISKGLAASESGISLAQQELNTNIVIRGIDIKVNAAELDPVTQSSNS